MSVSNVKASSLEESVPFEFLSEVEEHVANFPSDDPAFMEFHEILDWIENEDEEAGRDFLLGVLIGKFVIMSIDDLVGIAGEIEAIKNLKIKNICRAAVNSRVLLSGG